VVHKARDLSDEDRWDVFERMVITTSRSIEPSTVINISVNQTTSPTQLPSTESAKCWPNATSMGLPHTKLSSLFRSVKDNLGLRTPGVYKIPYECGMIFVGQTGHSMDIRLKEHQWQIQL
jgi:hypothetical protein